MSEKRWLCLLLALSLAAVSANAETHFHGDEAVPKIAVTVDDCYDIENVTAFLDLAKEHGFKLTFFPIGRAVRTKDAEVWRRVVAEGHEIGNHTNSHTTLTSLGSAAVERELTTMQNKLNRVLGFDYPIRLLRPPGGSRNGRVRGAADRLGYEIVMWSTGIQNAKEDEVARVQALLDNGFILLLHTNNFDVRMLEALLPAIQDKGLEMVTVSELLGLDAGDAQEGE